MRPLAKGLSIMVTAGVAAILGATATEATPATGGCRPTSTLGIRFTNVTSVRDASGLLRITHHEDGSDEASA